MLSSLAFLLTLTTLFLIGVQVVYVLNYQSFMESELQKGSEADHQEDTNAFENNAALAEVDETAEYLPLAAVVLCLKGSDANLVECLTGLVSQDYPEFELFLMVDSPRDPVFETVTNFFADRKYQPVVRPLQTPLKTCSLKCSALTEAIEAIPSRYEVIAMIDADCVPDQNWLADLVSPLGDASIGATTGNRWYTPADSKMGSWVRKLWNAAAVVQMYQYSIPWGGSLALRTETISRCGLIKTWRQSFCEDTSLAGELTKQKLKLHRVANLVLENTESTSLTSAFHWISRQLLTTRIHHPKWSWVAAHAFASAMVAIVTPVVILSMLCNGESRSLWTLVQTYIAWQAVNSWLLWVIERWNQTALDSRNSFNRLVKQNSRRSKFVVLQFTGTLLTQWLYPFTAWQASALTKVGWRGVQYKISAKGAIELIAESDIAADHRVAAAAPDDGVAAESLVHHELNGSGALAEKLTSDPQPQTDTQGPSKTAKPSSGSANVGADSEEDKGTNPDSYLPLLRLAKRSRN